MDIDKQLLPKEVRDRLGMSVDEMLEAGLLTRSRSHVVERRVHAGPIEVRAKDDGSNGWVGYAAVWDVEYEVAGGPPWGWTEVIDPGACTKSLSEGADVRFLLNHEGLPLARTKSGTLLLTADDMGLLTEVPHPDVKNNPRAQEFHSTLTRGDVDQMSWAFIALRSKWNQDYTHRRIMEAMIFDTSGVTFPANEVTIIAARQAQQNKLDERTEGMSLDHALAIAASLRR